jgi:hypothetical protein
VRVLLSEASSLTAREHLSVLGPTGIDIDVASCSSLAIAGQPLVSPRRARAAQRGRP